ncbi:hypothetical protein BDA96_03G237700 [Sorghum bicolor]|uniref:Uncharacterized protein n=1 Tax=Sorghum bicolor TaxID=4558 RepID=A0A921RDY3_SORBI|nr:hypothetical protein BDA96_03G237700 [Sorghum bicolor]
MFSTERIVVLYEFVILISGTSYWEGRSLGPFKRKIYSQRLLFVKFWSEPGPCLFLDSSPIKKSCFCEVNKSSPIPLASRPPSLPPSSPQIPTPAAATSPNPI